MKSLAYKMQHLTSFIGLMFLFVGSLTSLLTYYSEDLANLPAFDQSTPTNVTIYQGDKARLLCNIYNLQGKKVSWQIRDAPTPLTVENFVFLSNGHYEIENNTEEHEWNLIINRALKRDSGIYQCRVSSRTTNLVREIHLTVTDPAPTSTPAVTLGDSATVYIEKGKELTLQCNATAKQQIRNPGLRISPPEVEWFKDGNKINSHALNQIIITNEVHEDRVRISTLIIQRTDMDDAGIYVCRTTDKANAEVAVRILNVDRDNRKRGTNGAVLDSIIDKPENSASLESLSTLCILISTSLIYNLT